MSNRKGNTKSGKTQDQIDKSNYINQILGTKSTEDPQLAHKIELVKNVTDWPVEDIKRVLEECNGDPQRAISNIIDGLAGHPSDDWTVVSKQRVVKENKEQKAPREKGKNKGSKKPNTGENNQDKRTKDGNGGKENGVSPNAPPRQQNQNVPKKADNESSSQPESHAEDNQNGLPPKNKETRRNNKVDRPPTQQTQHAQQQSQQVQQNAQKAPTQQVQPPVSQVQQQQRQQQVQQTEAPQAVQQTQPQVSQTQQPQQQQTQQKQSPSLPPNQQTASSASTSAAPASSSQSSNYPRQTYHPPSLKTWKPKEGSFPAPSSPSTPQASQQTQQVAPVTQLTPSPVQQQAPAPIKQTTQQPPQQTPVVASSPSVISPVSTPQPSSSSASSSSSNAQNYSSTNTLYSNSPVVLPARATVDANLEFNFGTLNLPSNDYEGQYGEANLQSKPSAVSAIPAPQTYLDSTLNERANHLGMGAHLMNPMDSETHAAQLHAAYPYLPPGASHFMQPSVYPPYFEAQAMYEQQQFQTQYQQREPSPTESSKFSGTQRTPAANQQAYRDPKYNPQDANASSQPQTTSPTPSQNQTSSPAQQHAYGYSGQFYGYPYMPNQYPYQTPQSQYYRHPYMRGYPNYSTSTTAYPTPTSGTSISATGYPEDMNLAQDYKNNMFPVGASFFPNHGDTSMMGKNPQTTQQPQSASASGKGQSFSQPTGGSAANVDLSANASYKNNQQSEYKAYQASATNSSSYYMPQQQYGQSTQASGYPYVQHMQQPQQYTRNPSQPYLPDKGY